VEEDREKIISKALKLRELARRGIAGEKETAIRKLAEHQAKYDVSDDEMDSFASHGNSWFDRQSKEEKQGKFAKWFKRSVTVDRRTDKPMVFFHKSRETEMFFEFDHNKGTKYNDPNNYGFCFTTKEDKKYIEHIGNNPHQTGIGVEFFCYLKMLNPYYIYSRLDGNSYGQNGEQYRPIQINKTLADSLLWVGFDSIIIQDQVGINIYIVFNSNQIKSVDNSGEYSSHNNNIFE